MNTESSAAVTSRGRLARSWPEYSLVPAHEPRRNTILLERLDLTRKHLLLLPPPRGKGSLKMRGPRLSTRKPRILEHGQECNLPRYTTPFDVCFGWIGLDVILPRQLRVHRFVHDCQRDAYCITRADTFRGDETSARSAKIGGSRGVRNEYLPNVTTHPHHTRRIVSLNKLKSEVHPV